MSMNGMVAPCTEIQYLCKYTEAYIYKYIQGILAKCPNLS